MTPPVPLLFAAALAGSPGTGDPPATGEERRTADRPNVVVILADDMGWGDVRANNPASKIPTPHLDRLAAGGMRLTDGHAPAAWCTPTRYSLLTGRYPLRGRPWNSDRRPIIPPDVPTLPGTFAKAGYRTAMVGKWHLGFETEEGTPLSDARAERHRGGPVDRGFGSYFGIPVSLDIPPYYYLRGDRAVVAPSGTVGANASPGWSPIQGAFWRAGGIAPGFEHAAVLPDFRDEAVRFVTDAAEGGDGEPGPFLLYLALASPHTPWVPTGDPDGYDGGAGLYGQFMHETDAAVGAVLDALDAAGAAENTLVAFTSDNGPVWYDGDEARFGHAAAGPYRGMKGDAWEGGHRVPLLVRGPGVPAGAVSDALALHTDLFPSLAAACGVPLPPGAAPDGVNLWPVLKGKDGSPRTEAVFEATGERDSIRMDRDGREWKLIPWRGSGGFSKPKVFEPPPGEPAGQLYDLAADPGEAANRYAEFPVVVAELTARLGEIRAAGAR